MAPKTSPNTIASNKRARFEYHLHDEFEAGVQLAGWEVKALRAGRVQLTDSFVTLHRGEAYLHGCNINPLLSASTHVVAEPKRVRKLLLHRKELARLVGGINQKGLHLCCALPLLERPLGEMQSGARLRQESARQTRLHKRSRVGKG